MWKEIIILILLILIIFWLYLKRNQTEGFRLQARAYHSCPPLDCGSKTVHPSQLLRVNPFIWPYSATMYMNEFNVSKDVDPAHITPYHEELMDLKPTYVEPSA